MKTVFMVAEKPSLAASLANILSDGKNTSRKASNGACQIHEWKGMIFNQSAFFRMTSVCGHVLSIDFLPKFNNWDRVDPLELFSCPVERKEAAPKLRITSFLSEEARGSDYLILWLDCDKEGENICFEVIDAVKNSLRRSIHNNDVVWRARFSSITAMDVKNAMNNLSKPNKNESLSVDARQELDLRIGCAFTRFQTKYFQGKYGNLDSSLISFGPCQTPTLGFCVERHDQIQSFKPEPYWILKVTAVTNDNQELELTHQSGRIFDKEASRTLLNKTRGLKSLKVTNVVLKDKYKTRPVALNTVELMKHASSGLGMGPHYAMSLAERLYTQSYISYPRTETTSYSDNFDLKEVLLMYKDHLEYSDHVATILRDGINRPRKGVNVGDHPPITPTKRATMEELGDSWKLYDYIVRHFMATISKDCYYKNMTTSFVGNSETFTCSTDILMEPGFTQIMTWLAMNKYRGINFKVGDEVAVRNVNLGDYKTTPPDYLTESELITMMEKHGIGTDASIPVHINNVSQRNYVSVGSHRRLIPTNLGIVLVHGYQKIDKELVEPNMRSRLEEQLNLIALGKVSYDVVLADAIRLFKAKYVYFTKSIESMDHLFEVSFTPLSETGKALSRCGKCRRYMKYIQAKPSRLHCAVCNETYNMPQNGNIRKYKESRCPIDEFEILIWSGGAKGKSYPLCPYCYNNPPFEEMKKFSGCNYCIHPTCSESIYSVGIASCLDCSQGILCLDPSSAPKWKVVCNNCDTMLNVFEDAHKVTVDKDSCNCGAKFVKVEYKEEKTKLPGDRAEMLECMFCCPELDALVSQQRAVSSCSAFPTGRGRGGRGGHRKGRGRGRGGRGGAGGGGTIGGRSTEFGSGTVDDAADVTSTFRGGRGGRGGRRKHRSKPPKDRMAQLAAYFV